jgi:CheY-like chemotaxis protein
MRTEKEMLDLIIRTAKRDERIRAVQLRGSRTDPRATRDRFQDFNLSFYVEDTEPFKGYPKWINVFGERLMLSQQDTGEQGVKYQMLFADGVIMDLTLLPVDMFYSNKDAILLISKDKPKPAPDKPKADANPEKDGFISICNTFWWNTKNVAKGISRDELPYAEHYLNALRAGLFKMLEFNASPGTQAAFGEHWRFIKKRVSAKQYDLIKTTYANSDYLGIWKAMQAACALFREAAMAAASAYGYEYPADNDDGMTSYLRGLEEEIGVKPQPQNAQSNTRESGFQREYMPYGTVLIVDDMETNLFVSKSMLIPYGLTVDTATSGAEAIEKITANRNYDIVFMDHLMPDMDGITTANAILERGYTGPVVALTANSASGQESVFMSTGFDAFLSKPIDAVKLNAVLNKYIRDKQAPELLAEARIEMVKSLDEKRRQRTETVNAGLVAMFIRDAERAIRAMETYDKDNLEDYVINLHAMKSALGIMREAGLSEWAMSLEDAGRAANMDVIDKETPVFISALKDVMQKLSPDKNGAALNVSDEDKAFIQEKMANIRVAAEIFEKRTIKELIAQINQKRWPDEIKEMLDDMKRNLLHSNFEAITDNVNEILNAV